MSPYQIFRLSPHEIDRLAELHNQHGWEEPFTLAWSGDRLRAGYQGPLEHGEMAVGIAHRDSPRSGVGGRAGRGFFAGKTVRGGLCGADRGGAPGVRVPE